MLPTRFSCFSQHILEQSHSWTCSDSENKSSSIGRARWSKYSAFKTLNRVPPRPIVVRWGSIAKVPGSIVVIGFPPTSKTCKFSIAINMPARKAVRRLCLRYSSRRALRPKKALFLISFILLSSRYRATHLTLGRNIPPVRTVKHSPLRRIRVELANSSLSASVRLLFVWPK